NALLRSLDISRLDEIRALAEKYRHIEYVDDFLDSYQSIGDICGSWDKLKAYAQRSFLLQQKELMKDLEALQQTDPIKHHYISALALHRNSRVNIVTVIANWKLQKDFLEISEDHGVPAITQLHERLKPARYTELPHLDLTHEELVDGLIHGDLEILQAFTPCKIEYDISNLSLDGTQQLRSALQELIEDLKQGAPKRAGKLFHQVKQLLVAEEISPSEFFNTEPIKELSKECQGALQDLYTEYKPKSGHSLKVIAEVRAKNDPLAVIAGNDTGSCDAHGSGKRNIYSFNPGVGQFTLQLQRDQEEPRTIAQSTITLDRDLGTGFAEIRNKFMNCNEAISEALPPTVLFPSPSVLAIDSVEAAPNYRGEWYQTLYEQIYADFFSYYIDKTKASLNLEQDWVPIGLDTSDVLMHLDKALNTFAPLAPVAYSDKQNHQVLKLSLASDPTVSRYVRNVQLEPRDTIQATESRSGVLPLTYRHTLETAYLEALAFAGNEALIMGFADIEVTLIALDTANKLKQRPNLSFFVRSDQGRAEAYLIAYEGRFDGREEDVVFAAFDSKPIVYISDIASSGKGAGVSALGMVHEFIAQYKESYLAKGQALPIFFEAREQSTYRLSLAILKQLQRSEDFDFEIIEGQKEMRGDDAMYPLMIVPKKA
ncbi:MAG: hypothetical protein KDD62_07335, partial [Bdellovibrionales bacterium]|nr:hypothetical protein [Bdellovibrionales bacterium]